jgi:AcrR family transcriptional regulator
MLRAMGSQAAGPPGSGPLNDSSTRRDFFAVPSDRERLIAAMAAGCAERGYARTSVEDIVSRAGVAPESFERHFANKSECGMAALKQIVPAITKVASTGIAPESSDRSTLRAVKSLLELLAAEPSLASLSIVDARQAMPPEAYELYGSAARILAAMLDQLRGYSGAETPAPPSAARGAVGGAETLIRRELIAGRADRLPELLPDIVYGALVPFIDQSEALRYTELARELVNGGG